MEKELNIKYHLTTQGTIEVRYSDHATYFRCSQKIHYPEFPNHHRLTCGYECAAFQVTTREDGKKVVTLLCFAEPREIVMEDEVVDNPPDKRIDPDTIFFTEAQRRLSLLGQQAMQTPIAPDRLSEAELARRYNMPTAPVDPEILRDRDLPIPRHIDEMTGEEILPPGASDQVRGTTPGVTRPGINRPATIEDVLENNNVPGLSDAEAEYLNQLLEAYGVSLNVEQQFRVVSELRRVHDGTYFPPVQRARMLREEAEERELNEIDPEGRR